MAKVAQRQLVHSVAAADAVNRASGVEIEGDHHGIINRADHDPAARQNVHVIFDVLADLEHGIAFQQRLEHCQRHGLIHLLRLFREHVGAAVAKRNVAGIVGAERQTHPDEIGLHGIELRGFGIDSDQPRGEGAIDPGLKPSGSLHAFIAADIDRRQFRQRLAAAERRGGGTGFDRTGGIELHLALGATAPVTQPLEQAVEAVLGEEGSERTGRHRFELEIIERHRQRAVFLQLHQHPAEPCHIGLLDQAVAQLAGLHGGRGGERGFEVAIFLDQLGRGFRSDAADPGNIVHRIAHQREDIADQPGRHAELLEHFGNIDAQVLHRIEHVDGAAAFAAVITGGADELHQVLVRRNNRHFPATRGRRVGIGGDQIVRLKPHLLDARQRKCASRVANQRKLRDEILRRRWPMGFVGRIDVVAERFRRGIEDHRKVRRTIGFVQIIGQFPQHGGVTIDRTHRHPMRIGERWQAMIGPKDIGRTIDEIEMLR